MKKTKWGQRLASLLTPKRKGKAERLFDSKGKGLGTQEVELFLKFAELYPPADMKIEVALAVWNFLEYLKKSGHGIIHEETVFCVPFSRLVRKGDLR